MFGNQNKQVENKENTTPKTPKKYGNKNVLIIKDGKAYTIESIYGKDTTTTTNK